MATPPPFPVDSSIRHRIFHGQAAGGIRFNTAKALIERIDDAHRKAEEWLRRQPGIEVITISSGSATDGGAANAFFVTVWYREIG
ncbi:hypothetical protein OKA04_19575 [Luteolibacter flavescens]|uniref:Uncharacterized protein n=1 Tax=Luteolibacter flavescens TaxID=1859460 RepID=A0ABT3FUH2_9BACT|nr:hypothetical protein [Luteolibacter flavescens]MCW1886949.1 hypothetical protein [Luteolibacter flavescens]